MHESEERLVQRAKAGDVASFGQLYENHFNRVLRYIAIRIGDAVEAEDLTEQVFLKALEAIDSFQWRGRPFVAWLYRIAHNQVIDYLRYRAKQSMLPLEPEQPYSDVDPEEQALTKLDLGAVTAALERLSPAQREVISLRFAAGLSVKEVAHSLGRSEGAVKALQHSAIVNLRKALSRSALTD